MATKTIPRNCEICSAEFLARANDVKRGHSRYCSKSCFNARKLKSVTIQCLNCRKPFPAFQCQIKDNGGRKYCSQACHYAHRLGSLVERFWARVDKTPGHGRDGDCWMWTGGKTGGDERGRYGYLHGRGKELVASRVSYEIHHGEVPEGLFVLHHCDNPPCVNPDHLFVGTKRDNFRDMIKKGRRCKNGYRHKLTREQGAEICARYQTGEITQAELGLIYGVHKATIRAVIRNHNSSPTSR